MSDTIAMVGSQAQAAFAATMDGQPAVFVVQDRSARKVITVDSTGTGGGVVVAAYLSPDGSRLAYTVSESSLENLSLRLVNLSDGSNSEILKAASGEILGDFFWKPDGSALAYSRNVPTYIDSQPYICQVWTVPITGGAPAMIYGDDILQLLGWSPDGSKVHFSRRVEDFFAYSYTVVGSSGVTDVLLPDGFEGKQDLNVLGLAYAQSNGLSRLAYALNTSPYLENTPSTPVMIVEPETGSPVSQFRSQGAATGFCFSPDLSRLAFTVITFPGDSSGDQPDNDSHPTSAVQVYQLNGQVIQEVLAPGTATGQYTVLAWASDNSGLFVSGGDGSVQFVNFNGGTEQIVPATPGANPGMSVGGDSGASVYLISGAVVNLDVPYIHQVKMVPPGFDGNWACGPAAASMIAAYYKKLAPRNDTFRGNFTEYGWYISNVFTSLVRGYTFNRYEKDPKRRPFPGAYGHIVQNGLAYAWRVVDYFKQLGLHATFRGNVSASLVKSYLSAGKPVLLSTNIKGFGHIVVAKGFTLDGRIIVNDPYWGKPGAGEIIYAWWQFRGTPWMVTLEDVPPAGGGITRPPSQAQTPIPQPVEVGTGNPSLSDRFKAAYSRNGAENNIGKPTGKAFGYNQRWVQNFRGGPRGEGVIVGDERFDRSGDQPVPTLQPAFAVFGPFLKTWRDTYGGSAGILGSPLSDEFFNAQGNRQQNFEGGYILLHGSSDNPQGAFPWPSGFNSWKTEYFNNTGLAGKPAFIRDEPANSSGGFSYDWGDGAPDSGRIGILSDYFSVRFSRAIDFGAGGSYTFTVTSDDGFRLLIDGQNLAGSNGDRYWILTSATPRTFQVNLGGGVHTLVLEYFEATGGASVALDISQQANS
jgi:hypothetical protein